jgi:serine/threonine protein kinase
MDTKFVVPKKYEIIDLIGYGAYGVVVAAKDTSMPEAAGEGQTNLIAIKKIVKAFDHRVFSLRTYRELKIQRLLEHENVLGIKRILKPANRESFEEIYVLTELMETDLAQIIKSN